MPTTPVPVESGGLAGALKGQYQILREIGRGGMGIVYLARDLKLDRLVAIKTLPPHLAADPSVRDRFLREARMAGGLSHHNIVPVHRADEIDGYVFFVMGLVDGDSLAARIRSGGPLPPSAVARVMRDVADALEYAHSRHVVHRDVKAENILLDHVSGRAIVTDFGIARLAEAAPMTSTGQLLGTVYYMSPEQVSGDPIDARSDLYSLGVVGYFALTGRFPFDAELASAVPVAHVNKPVPPLRSIAPMVPASLAAIVERCLAKKPSDRFQSAKDIGDALAAIANDLAALPLATRAPLVSDTEAHALWQRAAELQANAGIEPRPLPVRAQRDPARDASRTSGHDVGRIRAAAAEAGIAPKYVEHALVEHGLSGASAARIGSRATGEVKDITPESENAFTGAPSDIHLEIAVDGEMSDRDYDLLADIVHRHTGDLGVPASVGRSFTWTSHARSGRAVHVTVLPRAGRTTIRVSDSIRAPGVALFAVYLALGGFGVGAGVASAAADATHSALVGLCAWLATVSTSYIAARFSFGSFRNSRERSLRRLAEAIAEQVKDSIDDL